MNSQMKIYLSLSIKSKPSSMLSNAMPLLFDFVTF